ncbi:hypothetical protein Ddye_014358 [Dipteronia dyeriana]|uniref:Reverse transcriptase zinc-binding domain-containing protein n=1 Tax=Dipteronia dyeriana TaxID=168575 RepID=A0AAD9X850_9ROSI|nr:hypothetical protein Ddye_014358 [Dipteronia dyeriana]
MKEASLFGKWNDLKVTSHFVKSIGSLFKSGSRSYRIIEKGFVSIIGKGDRADFLKDIRVDGKPVSEAFLRCFAGPKWEWRIPTGRPPFDWENDQWQIFSTILECIPVRSHISDSIAWNAKSDGMFSVKSLKQPIECTRIPPLLVWKGICPPKMELFLW